MITLLVRLRVDDWEQFLKVHDEPFRLDRRRDNGNLTHQVLSQLDDATDVVYLDTWASPQDADDYYHTDAFQEELSAMGGTVMEMIKLEETDAAGIGSPLDVT